MSQDEAAITEPEDPFEILFANLPRQGPGSDAMTNTALARIEGLPDDPVILDLGCGAGAQTLTLARALKQPIKAIDLHAPFLEQLTARAAKAKLTNLIDPIQGDMRTPPIEPASADLILCEGAALSPSASRPLWRLGRTI